MTESTLKKRYALYLTAEELAVLQKSANLSAGIMNDDKAAILYDVKNLREIMTSVGPERFDVLHERLTNLLLQAAKDGELEISTSKHQPQSPLAQLLEFAGFKVHEVNLDEAAPTPCCGHPGEGADTDPLCPHCQLRHP